MDHETTPSNCPDDDDWNALVGSLSVWPEHAVPRPAPVRTAPPMAAYAPGPAPEPSVVKVQGKHARPRRQLPLWVLSPTWVKSRVTAIVASTAGLPTLLVGSASLAEASYGVSATAVEALACVLAMCGTGWLLKRKMAAPAVATGGLAWLALLTTVSSAGSGWVDFAAWTLAAGTIGSGWLWRRAHRSEERDLTRAKTDKVRSDMRLSELKAQAALIREETRQVQARAQADIAQAKLSQLLNAPMSNEPDLTGRTVQESSLRKAFWIAFEAQLPACPVRPTLTGWIADVALPADLSRDAVKTGWNKVSTALALPGRFALEDGQSTDVLQVKFVDETKPRPDATWSPDKLSTDARKASLGVDTETGEPVFIDADERLLICGASGTGKSWSARPLMAHWHMHGTLVLIDGKGEEGNVWETVCSVAREPEEIYAAVDAAHAEMGRRKADMKARGISVWDGEQLTVVVDEGQVVLALPGLSKGQKGEKRRQGLRELSSLGRSRGVVLVWATQKPVMSGAAPGVDNIIAPNLLQRFSLRVADGQEAQTALDDCAHYGPQQIKPGAEWKGHGYLKGYGPSLIRTWTMNDAAVRALPAKHWAGLDFDAPPSLFEDEPEAGTQGSTAALREDLVREFLEEFPGASKRQVATSLGIPEGSIGRIIKKLRDEG